jgi:hypothetical protein
MVVVCAATVRGDILTNSSPLQQYESDKFALPIRIDFVSKSSLKPYLP